MIPPDLFDVLDTSSLQKVASFLPPRDMYNLALSCKRGPRTLSMNAVVYSCLRTLNRHTEKTLERLSCLPVDQIHPLTPFRVLTLVLGKRCENCNIHPLNFIRLNSGGLFLCMFCRNGEFQLSLDLSNKCYHYYYPDIKRIVSHPNTYQIVTRGHGVRILYSKGTERYVGVIEKTENGFVRRACGPIVTYSLIEQLISSEITLSHYLNRLNVEKDPYYSKFYECHDMYEREPEKMRHQIESAKQCLSCQEQGHCTYRSMKCRLHKSLSTVAKNKRLARERRVCKRCNKQGHVRISSKQCLSHPCNKQTSK